MEKLFYTLEEAAQRLGKSEDDVRQMASRGQLAEFRDRDRLMFKKEQVDLLAGGGEDEPLRLADSGELEPLGLASSGSAPGITPKNDAKENTGTGIALLDLEETDDADANAVTRISNAPSALVDPGEDKKGKSGSAGLLDLTREADDTSLGAGLLEDVYGSETVASATAIDAGENAVGAAADAGGGALFETPAAGGGADFEAAVPAMAAYAEAYDGPGSGLVGGLAVGAVLALLVGIFAMIAAMTGSGGGLVDQLGNNFMIIVGACAGVALIAGVLGWVLGKKG
jgi:hypothetical protein